MMNESVFESFPVLETERLQLVRHDKTHAQDMFVLRSHPDVMKYLDTHPAKSVTEIELKIEAIRDDFDNKVGINWIIQEKEQDEAIGYMSLWRIDKHNNRGEIGYALKKEYWNKGFATEAAVAVINYCFEKMKLQTIMANTNPSNAASQSLLTRLGFIKEAHFRQDYYFDGKYLDSAIYAIVRGDWEERNSTTT